MNTKSIKGAKIPRIFDYCKFKIKIIKNGYTSWSLFKQFKTECCPRSPPQALVSGKKNIVSRYIFFSRNKCLWSPHGSPSDLNNLKNKIWFTTISISNSEKDF